MNIILPLPLEPKDPTRLLHERIDRLEKKFFELNQRVTQWIDNPEQKAEHIKLYAKEANEYITGIHDALSRAAASLENINGYDNDF